MQGIHLPSSVCVSEAIHTLDNDLTMIGFLVLAPIMPDHEKCGEYQVKLRALVILLAQCPTRNEHLTENSQ
jgi:hypothetical protein